MPNSVTRVKGDAVFLTGRPHNIPSSLTHNLEHNRIIHSRVILLNFSVLEIPRVPNKEKIEIEDLGNGFYQVIAAYGFMESPNVRQALHLLAGQGLRVEVGKASYFLGREKLIVGDDGEISRWRARLFTFLSKNASDASAYFGIPEDRAIEVGIRLLI